jgi:hypothetical protein
MSALTLRHALRLYEIIRKSECTAYFSSGDKTISINDLPKTIRDLSMIKSKEILLVIEGENADLLYQKIKGSIKISEENARENPGLYRQEK